MDADVAYEVPYAYTVAASARAGGRKFATADAAARDGVLQLDATAKELCHERVTVDTRDHEDHTFCGVMFPVECRTELPCEYIELQSVSVRGDLGPMTVWYTRRSFDDVNETEEAWTRVYSGEHVPTEMSTSNTYTELRLAEAIRLAPGERVGMYVHSAMPGDNGLVYDNQRQQVTHADKVFRILPGYAHLSNRPFGTSGPWGRPWRTNREFVGRIEFGVRWKMWSPSAEVHHAFPAGFRATVVTMLLASRRPESLLYLLQDEILFFILNNVGDGRVAHGGDSDEDDSDGGGSLPPEEPEYEAGSDAWVAEQVRLSLALHPANFGAEDDEEADP